MRYAFTLLTLALLSACATAPAQVTRAYSLAILVPNQTGAPVPIGSMLVRNPQRQVDGSLCFERVEDGMRGCLKLFQYDLTEVEAK